MKETSNIKLLQDRKYRIETKLKKYGILNYKIEHLPYLQFDETTFQSPQEVAKRTLILYALSHASNGQFARFKAKKWLKKEALWETMTSEEQQFINTLFPPLELKMTYSWSIEEALVLNWTISKEEKLSQIIEAFSLANIKASLKSMPTIGQNTKHYISSATYRPLSEVFEENILNELVTSYFRDLMFSGEQDFTQINREVSFKRHLALNWIRQFGGNKSWQNIPTDT